MKAWILSVINEDDQGQEIVFADNAAQAKKKIRYTDLYAESWIYIRVRRYRELDDMEEASEFEKHLVQWRNGWNWYDESTPDPDITSDEEFKIWYKKNIGWVK